LQGEKQFVPFGQPGQYEDAETGLCYNRFRYYDSGTGCYISQDPIGLAGNNPTLYAYVSDSNGWVDPFGLSGMPPLSVLKDMAQNSLDFSTVKDGAVFWSGPNMKTAQEWAAANGKTTLEQTAGGKYLESLDLFNKKVSGLEGHEAAEIWDIASKRFAEGASGDVHVFSTNAKRIGPFGERTWWRIEKPALLKNKNVSTIFRMRKNGTKAKTGHIRICT
jgi:RHS repeat-associated protein